MTFSDCAERADWYTHTHTYKPEPTTTLLSYVYIIYSPPPLKGRMYSYGIIYMCVSMLCMYRCLANPHNPPHLLYILTTTIFLILSIIKPVT